MSNKPVCEGVKVVEIASMVSGPLAGQGLADLGAEVIKVEPLSGDPFGAIHGGLSSGFIHVNRGKKSIAINLKTHDGQCVGKKLCQSADVLIENCRPGVLDRLGLGYDKMSPQNPSLIYVSISGFGQTGPYKDRAAYDPVVQGAVGIMISQAREGRPQAIRNPFADKITGITATSAVLGALFFRERNGMQGQRVNLSMLDAFASFALPDLMQNRTFENASVERPADVDGYRPIRTADGWVICTIITDGQFQIACDVFGRSEMNADERFATVSRRMENLDFMWDQFETVTITMTTSQIMNATTGRGLPIGPVNSLDEFLIDPQAVNNGTFIRRSDPIGDFCQLKFPAEFSASMITDGGRAPLLGEHTADVLSALGYSRAEIDKLRARKVIAGRDPA